jgi:hypothetical protein
MSGNVGMLGRGYRGYFRTGDEQALADLIEGIRTQKSKLEDLRKSLATRRRMFSPASEKRALRSAISRTAR